MGAGGYSPPPWGPQYSQTRQGEQGNRAEADPWQQQTVPIPAPNSLPPLMGHGEPSMNVIPDETTSAWGGQPPYSADVWSAEPHHPDQSASAWPRRSRIEESAWDATGPQRVWRPPVRRSSRRMFFTVAIAALVIVTVAGVILTAVPAARGSLATLFHVAPVATATFAPIPIGGAEVFFDHYVPWATVTLDGKALPATALAVGNTLPRGTHTLQYQADPFPPLRCTISVPALKTDTCQLDKSYVAPDRHPLDARRAVDLHSTLEGLSTEQFGQLRSIVQAFVSFTTQSTTVRAGEHYLIDSNGSITVTLADQPLAATINQTPQSTVTSGPGIPTLSCASICVSPDYQNHSNGTFDTSWILWAHVKLGFSYRSDDGTVALDFQPLHQYQQATYIADEDLPVDVVWKQGGWQLSWDSQDEGNLQSIVCNNGAGELESRIGNGPGGAEYQVTVTHSFDNAADGCVIVARKGSGANLSGPDLIFYTRFGVLLAVNDQALAAFPGVIPASQHETSDAMAVYTAAS